MSPGAALKRLAAMDPGELTFRIGVELRKHAGRVRRAVARPHWRRTDLARIVTPGAVAGLDGALHTRDHGAAHTALAAHVLARTSCWPIRAAARADLSRAVRERFPGAAVKAAARADGILAGRYDLLGYRDLECGARPDWHLDPVHLRRAPSGYWSAVPYLDPSAGDHKVIWELNRHQHWLVLGRAHWLTGDGRYRSACVDQLTDWLRANPPLEGANWASMLELAFRCISWSYAVEFFAAGGENDRQPWLVDLLVGMDRQLAHVEQNLSRYFSPNTHLTGEALALYVVSLAFPELKASPRRAAIGRQILLDEATRQVRADGGHAEMSAHYHRYSTDFYLLAAMVARASGDPAADALESSARAQAHYLRTIADDRGTLPLIGDDDGGQLFAFGLAQPATAAGTLAAAADLFHEPALAVGAPPEHADWILGREPRAGAITAARWPSRWLPESGYFVSRLGGSHLVFDAGPHGFMNGGHAHADALAVTLSVEAGPVLVDPGTATYTMDQAARDLFRSPRMHNTVIVDRREHAQPRGPFHWAATADARFTAAHVGGAWDFAQGTHDGHGAVRHLRTVAALETWGWLVIDQLIAAGEHEMEAWWHVHPELAASIARDRRSVRLQHAAGWGTAMSWSAAEVAVLNEHPLAVYAPEYGRIEAASAIRACRRAAAPFATAVFIAAPIASAAPADPRGGGVKDELPSVAELRVEMPPPHTYDGRAFSIHLGNARLQALVAAPRDGRPGTWPRETWGTPEMHTDARFAVALIRDGAATTLAMFEGTTVEVVVASAVHS